MTKQQRLEVKRTSFVATLGYRDLKIKTYVYIINGKIDHAIFITIGGIFIC
jgi:hypothetical protein